MVDRFGSMAIIAGHTVLMDWGRLQGYIEIEEEKLRHVAPIALCRGE